jgi:regulator of sirC expression with transglutaminase-like and TPR domain
MRLSPASQRFYQEVQKADGRISLAMAALYIAQEDYWDMDPRHYIEKLDRMADSVRSRLPKNRYPLKVIQVINQYLFEELKFSGNRQNYYDPDNSCLNCVLDRRLGIPISLSLVYLEITARLGFPMVGVGMPGHFLIRPAIDEMEVFVDPFHQGEILFLADCQERFYQQYGRNAPNVQWQDDYVSAVPPKAFLVRMLLNLKTVYLALEAFERAIATLDKLLILMPQQPQQMRDRGLLHYELQQYEQAEQDLKGYLRSQPQAPDYLNIQKILDRIGL